MRCFLESYLKYPLAKILQHQYSGRVRTEVEHPVLAAQMEGAGKRPAVDFVVEGDGRYDLVIETKWLSKSKSLHVDLIRDIVRLDLLIPKYAVSAALVLVGKKKDVRELLNRPELQPVPGHANSKPVLPIDNEVTSVRFVKPAKHRRALYNAVLKKFGGMLISESIPLEGSGPFPRDARTNDYEVYVWKIRKYGPRPSFDPSDYYDLGK